MSSLTLKGVTVKAFARAKMQHALNTNKTITSDDFMNYLLGKPKRSRKK